MVKTLPLSAWNKPLDIATVDEVNFRIMHRRQFVHKQRVEKVRSFYDTRATLNETNELIARASVRPRRQIVADMETDRNNADMVRRLCGVMRDSAERQMILLTPRCPEDVPPYRGNAPSRRKVAEDIDKANYALLARLGHASPGVATSEELSTGYEMHRKVKVLRHIPRARGVDFPASTPRPAGVTENGVATSRFRQARTPRPCNTFFALPPPASSPASCRAASENKSRPHEPLSESEVDDATSDVAPQTARCASCKRAAPSPALAAEAAVESEAVERNTGKKETATLKSEERNCRSSRVAESNKQVNTTVQANESKTTDKKSGASKSLQRAKAKSEEGTKGCTKNTAGGTSSIFSKADEACAKADELDVDGYSVSSARHVADTSCVVAPQVRGDACATVSSDHDENDLESSNYLPNICMLERPPMSSTSPSNGVHGVDFAEVRFVKLHDQRPVAEQQIGEALEEAEDPFVDDDAKKVASASASRRESSCSSYSDDLEEEAEEDVEDEVEENEDKCAREEPIRQQSSCTSHNEDVEDEAVEGAIRRESSCSSYSDVVEEVAGEVPEDNHASCRESPAPSYSSDSYAPSPSNTRDREASRFHSGSSRGSRSTGRSASPSRSPSRSRDASDSDTASASSKR